MNNLRRVVAGRRHLSGVIAAENVNSFGLRNKVEHFLRMKDPSSAQNILQKSKIEGSEYSWNLLIKYYANQGQYDDAEKMYQQV
jgi:pentatricopeptide repeat protein